jgi:acetyl-CoA carboxylase carboxyl transferase subunit alpha
LNNLLSMSQDELIEQRYEKYKNIGQFGFVNDSIVVK